jgi:hypothetical protein
MQKLSSCIKTPHFFMSSPASHLSFKETELIRLAGESWHGPFGKTHSGWFGNGSLLRYFFGSYFMTFVVLCIIIYALLIVISGWFCWWSEGGCG